MLIFVLFLIINTLIYVAENLSLITNCIPVKTKNIMAVFSCKRIVKLQEIS